VRKGKGKGKGGGGGCNHVALSASSPCLVSSISAAACDLDSEKLMVQATRRLWVVFKETGGKLWNKPWGRKRVTQSQKENRRQEQQTLAINRGILKALAQADATAALSAVRTESRLSEGTVQKIISSCF